MTDRVKLCIVMFKEMAKKMSGKTVFAVSHGQFLHHLIVYLISGQNDRRLLNSAMLCPHNNSLTVIDFDAEEKPSFKEGEGPVTVVTTRLVAHNMQVILNSHNTSTIDFTP